MIVVLGIVGCAGDSGVAPTGETGRELVELVDEGQACLHDLDEAGPFTARVVLEDCASGCAADVQASCEVRLVQTEVVVTATGSYTLPLGDVSCDDVCVEVAAECAGESLAAGSYTLDYAGGHSEEFTVPGTVAVPCAEPL